MKRFLATLLSISLLGSAVYAKSTAPKKRGFAHIKKERITKLERKRIMIEKRLSCIKKATSTKEIRACEKKYPLLKRNKKKKMMKNLKKQ